MLSIRAARVAMASMLAAAAVACQPAASPASRPNLGQVHIHDIQGVTRISPFNGRRVTGVPGIVIGVRSYGSTRGFWFQDPTPDKDPRTSEGIFVATGGDPTVVAGDSVTVDGTVLEFYPRGEDGDGQSLTEISDPTVHVVSHDNPLPRTIVLRAEDIPDHYAPPAATPGESIERRKLEPRRYALDLFESLEGMNVEADSPRVVGPTDKYHELWITLKPQQNPTPRGGTIYRSYEQPNTGRIQVASLVPLSEHPFPQANVGDHLTGPTVGPMDYSKYGGYTIMANSIGTLASGGIKPEKSRPGRTDELTIATYNVENLAAGNSARKFARLAEGVVQNLASPDIVALEEIQDNDGKKDDGVVAADQTMAKLIAAIKSAGGPAYDWRAINPENDADGGEPGGNIRQVLMFNPARVAFKDIAGGDAGTPVSVTRVDGKVHLSASPGRIAPQDPAWKSSRKPLVGEFIFHGRTFFVIANHLAAKLGDQGLDSRFQPPRRGSETQRLAQARVEHDFIRELLSADKDAPVVVLGDMNDFPFSASLRELAADRLLRNLFDTLPANERYSYVYQGNSQAIDHMLVSPAIRNTDYSVIHVNAEFTNQASDHDPQVLRITVTPGS
jgi:predicted extracellular nuclease